MKKYVLLLGVSYLGSSIAAEPIKPEITETNPALTQPSKNNKTKTNRLAPAASDSSKSKKTTNEAGVADKNPKVFNAMVVTAEVVRDSHYTSPSTRVNRTNIERQNAQTTEEALKYQPSLNIRQRYIGDPNGLLSIRGSGLFATGRNMVFADGMPLHNLLQARWDSSPRWSLVGPNEIDAVDTIYGPYSAEYSGNSMGGVVNIKTHMPMKEEYYAEGSYATQPYQFQGGDKGSHDANRQYFSYGNRFKDLSVFLGYNRLESESQPMSYRLDNTGLQAPGTRPAVNGAVPVLDSRGKPSMLYGDSGPELVHTDLVKLKLGYDITPDLQTIFTGAYEERTRFQESARNYLTTATGGTIYGNGNANGTNNSVTDASAFGSSFNVKNTDFGPVKEDRGSVQLGLQLKGALTKTWDVDTTISYMDVFKDEKTTAFLSPNDPRNNGLGNIAAFDEYNWKNYDLKLSTKELFGLKPVEFLGGYHWDNYNMGFQQFDLANYSNSTRGAEQTNKRNTGETTTHAVFGQVAYHFMPDWDLTLGARYEWWRGENGLVGSVKVPNRNDEAISPKASLGFEPGNWKFRYSMGRAYRFPVIAELYQSLSTPTSTLTASSSLSPEDGWYHNFMIEYGLTDGYIRTSVFKENIRNAIQNVQRVSGPVTASATQNIPETSALGVEFIFDQQKIFDSNFDFNFNTTWTDAIVEDGGSDVSYTAADGTTSTFSLNGKKLTLVPEWRLAAITTYHITNAWDATVAGRYNSKMYGDVDNKDYVEQVQGAQDEFFFMDFKTSYRFKPRLFDKQANTRVSFGINNLTDAQAFVAHPYPQRTFFLEGAISF